MKTYDDVTAAFQTCAILQADEATLKELLVAIATSRIQSPVNDAVASRQGDLVKLLLSSKQTDKLHAKTYFVSIAALAVAALSLIASIMQATAK